MAIEHDDLGLRAIMPRILRDWPRGYCETIHLDRAVSALTFRRSSGIRLSKRLVTSFLLA